MPDYNTMRQDAVRKAIEMQAKAKQSQSPAKEEFKEEKEEHPHEELPVLQKQENKTDIFTALFQDSERTLLLVLLILLSSENADPALIFALLYLCL